MSAHPLPQNLLSEIHFTLTIHWALTTWPAMLGTRDARMKVPQLRGRENPANRHTQQNVENMAQETGGPASRKSKRDLREGLQEATVPPTWRTEQEELAGWR